LKQKLKTESDEATFLAETLANKEKESSKFQSQLDTLSQSVIEIESKLKES